MQGLYVANLDGNNSYESLTKAIIPAAGATTLMAVQQYSSSQDIWVPYASACLPISSAFTQFAGVEFTSQTNRVGFTSTLLLMENANLPAFQMPKTLLNVTPNDTNLHYSAIQTAMADMFIVGQVSKQVDGARGYLNILINPQSSGGALTGDVFAGASIHSYDAGNIFISDNTFCVPLAQGNQWAFEYASTYLGTSFSLFIVELASSGVFSNPTLLPTPISSPITAASDCFVHGYVQAVNDGDRSTLKIDVSSPPPWATYSVSASQHWYTTGDVYIPINTASAAVKQGGQYAIHSNITYGSPNVSVYYTQTTGLF